jgi:hypothetical protein
MQTPNHASRFGCRCWDCHRRTIVRHLFVDRARNADIDAVGRAIV